MKDLDMKKTSLVAIASLLALSSAASAQSFDINTMPLGDIPAKMDNAPTGSIAAKKVFERTIKRDGVKVTQYYTIAKDGSDMVLSEEAN
jgi:hypothetical protein